MSKRDPSSRRGSTQGIVANDRMIVSWDGSRIAGYDKERPRVEIEITGAKEESA